MKLDTISYSFDVSILVLTYNQDISRLYKTLDSIIAQKRVRFEIIVCDDGSENRYENELCDYFSSKHFCSYRLVFHDCNRGTVYNYFSGLKKAKGKYTKVISPGDYFFDNFILSKWLRFLEDSGEEWSFSDAYYYRCTNEKEEVIIVREYPQIIEPYMKKQKDKCRWNYVVLRDSALGAAILGTTQIQISYCKLIKEKGVIYAEDNIYSLMMFYGSVGCYFPQATIYYEYGTGISTSNNAIWRDRLTKDRITTYQIILDEKNTSDFQKKMQKAMSKKTMFEKFFIRGKLYNWLKWHFFPRLTKKPETISKYED